MCNLDYILHNFSTRSDSCFTWPIYSNERKTQRRGSGSSSCHSSFFDSNELWWIVCACTDLFETMACGMRHMHVYEECSWTCWIGSVLLYFHIKDWCGWGIFGTGCPLSENSFGSSYVHQMPLTPDMSLLHDWQTWRWNFTAWPRDDHFLAVLHVLTLSRIYLSPLFSIAPSLMSPLYAFNDFCFAHFLFMLLLPFCCCCILQALVIFSMKRQGLIHSCISSYYPMISNNIVPITGFQYLSNTITSSLVLIVMLQLKWLH